MSTKKVYGKVLPDIKPNKPDPSIQKMLERVNKLIKKNNLNAEAIVGGSLAKGTNLAKDYDVDIFVKFNLKYEDQDLSKLLHKVLKPLKPKKVHGSRDYFQLNKGKINYEFIPVLNISQTAQAKNITDCSPLHAKWFLKKGKKYQDDVRLAKMFCKAAKVYGAESYIRGFSGHTLDILIVHYGGFENLLNAALKWKEKTVVDPENAHKGKALKTLNSSKIEGPLVVIDPVEPFRNAASGLSSEKFHQFIEYSRRFLSDPHHDHFTVKKTDLNKLKKQFPHFLTIDITGHPGKADVVGSKMFKIYQVLNEELQEFNIIESGWDFNKKTKATLWFGLAKNKREKEVETAGPPLKSKQHVKNFKNKHKTTYTKSGRIYAKVKRSKVGIEAVTKSILNKPYLKQRMKKCSVKLH